jgi:Iron-containing redox enzyme
VWLESQLQPYYGIHKVSWRRLMQASGPEGFWATLGQLYHTMNLSAPLMRAAGRKARTLGPEYADYAEWCDQHAEEEEPHAQWLLDDVAKAGRDPRPIAESIPEPEIVALMGAQFVLAEEVDPTAILGYTFATEGHPSRPEDLRATAERFGLPLEALTTLLFHTEEDIKHGAEATAVLVRYADSDRRRQAMARSATAYLTGWSCYFRRLVEQYSAAR